jgi:hypothetical protein
MSLSFSANLMKVANLWTITFQEDIRTIKIIGYIIKMDKKEWGNAAV